MFAVDRSPMSIAQEWCLSAPALCSVLLAPAAPEPPEKALDACHTPRSGRPLFSDSYDGLSQEVPCFEVSTHSLAGNIRLSILLSIYYALFGGREKEQLAYFQSLPHNSLRSFATVQESTPLFSYAPALFVKNTREVGTVPLA